MQSSFEETRRQRLNYATRGFKGAFTAPRKAMSQAFLHSVEQDEGLSMFLGLLGAAASVMMFFVVIDSLVFEALVASTGLWLAKPVHLILDLGSAFPCIWLLWKAHERWGYHAIKHQFVSELRAWRQGR